MAIWFGYYGVKRCGWMQHALTGASYVCAACDGTTPYRFKVVQGWGYQGTIAWDLCESCAIKIARKKAGVDERNNRLNAASAARRALED